ncbi:MAG: hypothetical protein WCP22_05990 [Chlamydiota bacterium]
MPQPRTSCGLSIIAIALVSGLVLFTFIERNPYMGDESYWISDGFYCSNLLAQGDFTWEKWQREGRRENAYANIPLGKLLTGLPLRITKQKEFWGFYNWSISEEKNRTQGRIPPRDTLLAARMTPACFGVLCCVALFLAAYHCTNLCIGLIACALLISNRTFIANIAIATADAYYNFFLICVFLASLALLTLSRKSHLAAMSALIGAAGGLACSVKITGLPVAAMMVIAALLYRHAVTKGTYREMLLYIVIFSFVALLVAFSLNPFLWPSFKDIDITSVVQEMKLLSRDLIHHTLHTADLLDRYPQLANLSHPLYLFVMPLRWDEHLQGIATRLGSGWQSNRMKYRVFHRTLFVGLATFPGEWFFLLVGFVVCIKKLYSSFMEKKISLWAIPLLYFLCNYFFILAFMKLNWGRYYLPTIIAGRVIVATGIYATLSLLIRSGRSIARIFPGQLKGPSK